MFLFFWGKQNKSIFLELNKEGDNTLKLTSKYFMLPSSPVPAMQRPETPQWYISSYFVSSTHFVSGSFRTNQGENTCSRLPPATN